MSDTSKKGPQAVGEYVLVELYDPKDRTTKSGIVLPAGLDDKPSLKIVSKGSKVDSSIEIGDYVELSEGIRVNCFYGRDDVTKFGVIHQKYIAATWGKE